MLKYLNLSLSSRCSLNCAFCPNGKHARREAVAAMTPQTAERILEQARDYPIVRVDVGETGDAFLNQDILDILRLIRRHLPQASTRVFTNFQTFRPDRIDGILSEQLLDEVITNMDGATAETYEAIKGGSLERAVQHIEYFLEQSKLTEYPPTFRMQVLTLHRYVQTVRRNLGRDPLHVPPEQMNVADDFKAIQSRWRPTGVEPVRSFVALWAEAPAPVCPRRPREWLHNAVHHRRCRLLPRLRESLFVAPDGTTYLCCADFDFELSTGNLMTDTLQAILEGAVRQHMLQAVESRAFNSVGGPCRHFPLCQAF